MALCGLFFQLPHTLLHFLTRLESHDVLFRHVDAFTRAGIAGLPRRAFLDFKHSEIPELDTLVGDQCLDNRIKRLLYDFLGLQLRETNFFGNRLNYLFLGHNSSLPREVPCGMLARLSVGCNVSQL